MSTTIIKKPKVEISPDILNDIKTQTDEIGQVVLHFIFTSSHPDDMIRIWPTTYLYDQHSDHRSKLISALNITKYPEWKKVVFGKESYFTLIFTGLPKSCTIFDFQEHCALQAGEFKVPNIRRNASDVYYLRIH